MVLAKSLPFLDTNILFFMKKLVRLIFQKFIEYTHILYVYDVHFWKVNLTIFFIKDKILQWKNDKLFAKTNFLYEAPLLKYN